MRKSSKTILGIFCAGVLAMGIGSGIAFAEFTGLEYGGSVTVGQEGATDHVIMVDASQADGNIVITDAMAYSGDPVIYDSTLPAGTIKIVANYNDEMTAMYLWEGWDRLQRLSENDYVLLSNKDMYWYEDEYGYEDEEGYYGAVNREEGNYLYFGSGFVNDFQFFWAIKDQVLAELKAGVISEHVAPGIFSLQVYASPDLKGRIVE